MSWLSSLFGGGSSKSSSKAADNSLAWQKKIYKEQKADAKKAEQKARKEAAERAKNIKLGLENINKAFSGHNNKYYNNLARQYKDRYLNDPTEGVQKQYNTSLQQLLANASRGGTLQSSMYAKNYGDLQTALGSAKQDIAAGAEKYADAARSQIASQKNALISQLNATAGEKSMMTPFLAGRVNTSAPTLPQFSPLGDLFRNVGGIMENDAYIANAQGKQGFFESGVKNISNSLSKYIS